MTPARLAEIHRAAFGIADAWSEDDFSHWLAQPTCLLASHEAAFVLGRTIADEAEILTLASHPHSRRRAYARDALTAFETAAHLRGVREIFLEVAADNTPALSLYASAKYELIGKRPAYYRRAGEPAMDAALLRKTITCSTSP